jgi:hypothetical protein
VGVALRQLEQVLPLIDPEALKPPIQRFRAIHDHFVEV